MRFRYSIVQLAIVGLLLYCPLAGNAQTSFKKKVDAAPVKTYTVGDKVPDLVFKNLVNYPLKQASLSDFKGKLVLIDFWELTCAGCIAAFPKIQAIQEKYRDQVQVFTVIRSASPEEYTSFSSRFPGLKDFSLPVVLQDDQLYKYFPHEFISHIIWIDGRGVVKAITGTDYITPENIELALKDEHLPWPIKKDVIGFDYEKPLMEVVNGEVTVPAPVYYSALTGYMEGIDGTDKMVTDSSKQTITYNHFNHTLLSLASGSLLGQGAGYIDPKYLLLEVKDRTRYLQDAKTQYYNEWAKRNTYCYSVTLPLGMNEEERKSFIRKDLTRWLDVLGISVKKEMRDIACYALVAINKQKIPIAVNGGNARSHYEYPKGVSILKNEKLSSFINYLNRYNSGIPKLIINETGLPDTLKVNMEFSKQAFSGTDHLRKELQSYGLDLVPTMSRVEVHVITEKEKFPK